MHTIAVFWTRIIAEALRFWPRPRVIMFGTRSLEITFTAVRLEPGSLDGSRKTSKSLGNSRNAWTAKTSIVRCRVQRNGGGTTLEGDVAGEHNRVYREICS